MERMNIHILSTHLLSHLNACSDEFNNHVREMGNLLAVVRRTRLLAGIDSNLQFDSRFHDQATIAQIWGITAKGTA